jgi:hypothetical protein
MWTEAGGFKRLYEPETDDTDVLSLAVSPAGEIVVEIASGQPLISQLFLFDLKTGKPTDQLTRDASNAWPAW